MADEPNPSEPAADRPPPGAAWSPPPEGAGQGPQPPVAGRRSARRGWTAGRIVALVIGVLLVLVSLALVALGGAATWLETHKDHGYVSTGSRTLSTPGYALASNRLDLGRARWRLLGTLRIRATGQPSSTPVFVGIGQADQVARYLTGVQYTTVDNVFTYSSGRNVVHNGGAPPTPPGAASIWTARTSGVGTQTLVWPTKGGNWSVVVMKASGAPNVSVHADVGATYPPLPWVALGLVVGGLLLFAGSAALIVVPVRRATRRG
ncbi:MAG: hypothetical protein E6G01_07620 [Actinobacteria bacterium]|nr:MAG: hypothetical protein E6G01_07620 [Actinomycetota bacterium]